MTNGWIAQQRKIANRTGAGFIPSAAVLDKIAEETITGGFKIGKSNICGSCFTARSANGSCSCE